jgi:hypothetical protein
MASAGCGKKGPPLTPFVLVPSAPAIEAPRRVGDDVVVRVTVPATNLDGSKPAAIARIDLFGATALTPPPRTRFLEIATLVGSVPVASAGEPGDLVVTVPDANSGVVQGSTAVVLDTLTAAELEPRELTVFAAETPRAAVPPGAVAPPPPPSVLRRFYMAVAYSGRNVSGPPSAIAELPITVLPAPPADLDVTYTEVAAVLQWAPSDGLRGWLLDRALPAEDDPIGLLPRSATAKPLPPPTDWLAGPTLYNVYRDMAPDPLAVPLSAALPPWRIVLPAPVNPAPLATLRFDDPLQPGDLERCYHVRPLRSGVEGPPSPRRCVRPLDVFPPATPTNLQTVVRAGAIDLIWDPNADQDLGGYVVLRGEGADATLLLPVSGRPVTENRYSDSAVTPGVTYTYEVRAVDSRVPVPNMSEPARVTETAP